MDEKQFCFIICYNDTVFLEECMLYINQLYIPYGYLIDIITIAEADSITEGTKLAWKPAVPSIKSICIRMCLF